MARDIESVLTVYMFNEYGHLICSTGLVGMHLGTRESNCSEDFPLLSCYSLAVERKFSGGNLLCVPCNRRNTIIWIIHVNDGIESMDSITLGDVVD